MGKRDILRIELPAFSGQGVTTLIDVSAQLNMIARVMRAYADNEAEPEVVFLQKASPLTVEARLRSRTTKRIRREPLMIMERSIRSAISGRAQPKNTPAGALEVTRDFVKYALDRGLRPKLVYDAEAITIGKPELEAINRTLDQKIVSFGGYMGRLLKLDLNNNPIRFSLAGALGREQIPCSVSQTFRDQVVSAVDKVVQVTGKASYRANSDSPFEVRVETIEVVPPAPIGAWSGLISSFGQREEESKKVGGSNLH